MVVFIKHKGVFSHKVSRCACSGGSIELGNADRKTQKGGVGDNPVLAVNLPSSLYSTHSSQDKFGANPWMMETSNAVNGGSQPIVKFGSGVMDKFKNLTFREGKKKSDKVKLKL